MKLDIEVLHEKLRSKQDISDSLFNDSDALLSDSDGLFGDTDTLLSDSDGLFGDSDTLFGDTDSLFNDSDTWVFTPNIHISSWLMLMKFCAQTLHVKQSLDSRKLV
jgi:hypothetical protein